jgi:NAD(P)-dependent dehydrogenase (short-subunit alcohol dehydrogenase family)
LDLLLSGRTAIVTGGSRGIGRGIAAALAAEGVAIAILSRDLAVGRATAAEIAAETGERVGAFAVDVAEGASVEDAVNAVVSDFGPVDILVNCAALPGTGDEFDSIATVDSIQTLAEIDVKVFGCVRTARAVAPRMVERGWGRIINIGGVAAYHSGTLAAGIRTIGVGSITKNMADELGPYGVTVNCLHPGPTLTDRSRRIVSRLAAKKGKSESEIQADFSHRSTIGRFVQVSEIADFVTFLASPRAAAINGESIEVSGGSKGMMRY